MLLDIPATKGLLFRLGYLCCHVLCGYFCTDIFCTFRAVLCCSVLFCDILFSSVLTCSVIFCAVLCWHFDSEISLDNRRREPTFRSSALDWALNSGLTLSLSHHNRQCCTTYSVHCTLNYEQYTEHCRANISQFTVNVWNVQSTVRCKCIM